MPKKKLKEYITNLLLLGLITSLLSIAYAFYMPGKYISNVIYWFSPFFVIISLAGRLVMEYFAYSKTKWIDHATLGVRGAKFILYLTVMLFYAFYNREDAVIFILTFFVFYLVFAFFDARNLYSFLKKK